MVKTPVLVAPCHDPSIIVSTLNAAYEAPDLQTRNRATDLLAQWSAAPGYHATLQEITAVSELPAETRLLAFTQLRSGIDKYWRRGTSKYGSIAEKTNTLY